MTIEAWSCGACVYCSGYAARNSAWCIQYQGNLLAPGNIARACRSLELRCDWNLKIFLCSLSRVCGVKFLHWLEGWSLEAFLQLDFRFFLDQYGPLVQYLPGFHADPIIVRWCGIRGALVGL